MRWTIAAVVLAAGLGKPADPAHGGEREREPAPASVDYVRDVKPLLARRCYSCHGALKQRSGLRLDTAALMRQGGDGGPAVVAGRSDESPLIEAVAGQDGWRMPPEGEGEALSAEQVALLKAWVDAGAKAPADEQGQADPRRHWAFLPPKRPEVPGPPAADRPDAARNPIDALLAVEHARHGLIPRPEAAPAELIRRVALDLTGLAPTPEEVRAFVADPSDRAYRALVDRLLDSPRYGERWGRHWMDVWRYSDWDGYGDEVRESQPNIWRWRDWIVESLNRDEPYDRMVVAMLAADEARPDDPDALRATGYLVRNWFRYNRNVWLDRTVEHTAKAFLGLTFNCCRCHDHKYDPVSQKDYYALRAFFEPHDIRTDRLPGHPDPTKGGLVRVFDAHPETPTYLFHRGDEAKPEKEKPIPPGLPPALQASAKLGPIVPVTRPESARSDAFRPFVESDLKAAAHAAIAAAEREVATLGKPAGALAAAEKGLEAARADLASLEARLAADRARLADPPQPDAAEKARAAGKAERRLALLRAEEQLLRAEVALGEAEAAGQGKGQAAAQAKTRRNTARQAVKTARAALDSGKGNYTPIATEYPAASTGRRLALAQWITARDNPLTARVAVNHIWMRHFGAPLVPTVTDFGVNGAPPTHPALLDWLAVELMDSGWRMKDLHRRIVTSAAYRRDSSAGASDAANREADPANRYYWRMNPRRMEAEAVRDNVLLAAGRLDPAMGGPDLDPNAGQTSGRRSLYFRHSKEKQVTFVRLFDSANVLSCYRRSESVVPQQALALANSPLSLEQSRRLARTLTDEVTRQESSDRDAAFVDAAFARVLGREPTAAERAECRSYLAASAARLADPGRLTPFPTGAPAPVPPSADPGQRARESLVHVLFNHNDFLTIR
jgi:hypothetical protein